MPGEPPGVSTDPAGGGQPDPAMPVLAPTPEGTATPHRASRSRWTAGLGWHLIVPIAAAALPLILMDIGIIWTKYKAERSCLETQLVDYARSLSRLVDREFSRTIMTGEVLAGSTALGRGDLTAFAAKMHAARDLLAVGLPDPTEALITPWDAWAFFFSIPMGARTSRAFR